MSDTFPSCDHLQQFTLRRAFYVTSQTRLVASRSAIAKGRLEAALSHIHHSLLWSLCTTLRHHRILHHPVHRIKPHSHSSLFDHPHVCSMQIRAALEPIDCNTGNTKLNGRFTVSYTKYKTHSHYYIVTVFEFF